MNSRIKVDGEELAVVTSENVEGLFREPDSRKRAVQWLEDFSRYGALQLTVRRIGPLEIAQPIVKIGEESYRTHVERAMCEKCGHRVSAAAVAYYPDFSAGLPSETEEKIRKKALALPILSCPKCGERYSRRGIVWIAKEEEPNQTPEPTSGLRPAVAHL